MHQSAIAALARAYTKAMEGTQAVLPETSASSTLREAWQEVFNILSIHFLHAPEVPTAVLSHSQYSYRLRKIVQICDTPDLAPLVKLQEIRTFATARKYKARLPKPSAPAKSGLTPDPNRVRMPG